MHIPAATARGRPGRDTIPLQPVSDFSVILRTTDPTERSEGRERGLAGGKGEVHRRPKARN